MKKHLSVFGLFARSSIFKVIGILVLMCVVEIIVFHMKLQDTLNSYELIGLRILPLEHLFSHAAIKVAFRVAFILISIAICLPGCAFKSNTSYTLRRLSISERATFFYQATYNILVYLIFIAVQLMTAFALSQYYIATVPSEYVNVQTITLAFYRNAFLHSLLPMDDIGLWVRNLVLLLSLGLAAAEYPYCQRRHKFSATLLALVLYMVIYFDQEIGQLSHVISSCVITLIIIGEVIYNLIWKYREED